MCQQGVTPMTPMGTGELTVIKQSAQAVWPGRIALEMAEQLSVSKHHTKRRAANTQLTEKKN